ncbi:MAG: hypothetical protein NTW87_02915 [Planctomycetota bacterium]|nr:hypothetical protein [Planctomycetota bacterium]
MAKAPASKKAALLTPPAKPSAKGKRPKFAPGSGTPRQRAIMLGAAALCVIAAVLFPRPAPDTEEPPARAQPKAAPPPAPAPPAGAQATAVAAAPEAGPASGGGNTANAQPELPPAREAVPAVRVKPEELDARLQALDPYFRHYKTEEREEAYKILLACGPALVAQLPKLIETADGIALCNVARAAGELKVTDAIPALIARLEAKDKPQVAQAEMIQALALFDDAKARAYLLLALQGRCCPRAEVVWNCFGENMDAKQLELAFQTATGGGPNSLSAAKALGRYGTPGDKAVALVERIQGMLPDAKGTTRLRLVQALAGMNPDRAGTALSMLLADTDPEVRAAALTGLARSSFNTSTLLDALQRDPAPQVRQGCARALAAEPSEEVLPIFLELLDDPDLRAIALTALVRANKGVDLGTHAFVWRNWYHARHPPPQPKPKVPPAEGAEEEEPKEDAEAPQE